MTSSLNVVYTRRVKEYVQYVFFFGAPLFLFFGIVDFIYRPDLAHRWILYRLLVVALGSVLLYLIKISKNYYVLNICFLLVAIIVTNTINLMIYESGGYSSLYFYGLLLVNTFLVVSFRMSINQNIFVSVVSYIPTIFIIFSTVPSDEFHKAIALSSFLIGMAGLTLVFTLSDTSFFDETLREKLRHKREEVLTKYFPVQMRHLVSEGAFEVKQKATLDECLVGFIDIVSSTRIGNELSLEEDWELKERFLECAVKRAQTFDMFILNQMGDGILFISDYNKGYLWQKNLVDFFRHVSFDFEVVLERYKAKLDDLSTGIKCGATLGQATIGFIGKTQSFYTVMGPTVNLAARLASQAKVSELAITNNVFQKIYRTHDVGIDVAKAVSLKGFVSTYDIIKLHPASFYDMVSECAACAQMMSLIEINGHIHIICKSCDVVDHRDEPTKINQAA